MNYFQLLKQLYEIYDSLAGQVVNDKKIIRCIRKAVPFKECRIIGNRSLSVAMNNFDISGQYDPEQDAEGEICIDIEITFPKRKESFSFTEDDLSIQHWSDFCINFAVILGHEYMHLNQFRRRNFNWCRPYRSKCKSPSLREKQEYYGDSDEIDAYAFTAAANIIVDSTINPKSKRNSIKCSFLYKTYAGLFHKNDPVVLKFEKLTDRYLKKLERQYHDTTFD